MDRRFIVSIAYCTLLLGCSKQLPQLPLQVDNEGGIRLKEMLAGRGYPAQGFALNNCGGRARLNGKLGVFHERIFYCQYSQFKGPEPLYVIHPARNQYRMILTHHIEIVG